MSLAAERLAPLQQIYPGARSVTEGGHDFVFIPGLAVQVGGTVRHLDALLCPQEHSSYKTRLFLAEPIAERPTIHGQPANWSVHPILGRSWHTWSWQGVEANQFLLHILLGHLKALR